MIFCGVILPVGYVQAYGYPCAGRGARVRGLWPTHPPARISFRGRECKTVWPLWCEKFSPMGV